MAQIREMVNLYFIFLCRILIVYFTQTHQLRLKNEEFRIGPE